MELRYAGMALPLDEAFEAPEILLPIGRPGIPCPTWNRFQSSLALRLEHAVAERVALAVYPRPEVQITLAPTLRNTEVALALHEAVERCETFLPGGPFRVP